MKTMAFVSNLYPSDKDPTFGVFVKKSKEDLEENFLIKKIIVINRRKKSFLKLASYIKKSFLLLVELIKNKNDVFYFHYLTHLTLLVFPFVKKRVYIVNVHGHDFMPTTRYQKIWSIFNKKILNHAACIVCPSEFSKNYLLQRYEINNEKKIIINYSCGVDVNFCFVNECIKKYNFIYVGRIDRDKNWRAVINSIRSLMLKKIEFKICICGTGSEEIVLNKLISDYGLQNYVDIKGAVPNVEIPRLINQSNYMVFPSLQESLGLVVLESMACGVPVIAYNLPPMNNNVSDKLNGFLVDPEDSEGLTNCLMDTFNVNDEKYLQMVNSAVMQSAQYNRKSLANKLAQDIYKIL